MLIYFQLLHIVIPPVHRDNQLVDRFQKVVGTLVTLIEPVPLETLARLAGTANALVWEALDKLPSVISVPEDPQGIPQIYHPSFPGFLKDPRRCLDEGLLIVPSRAHAFLASSCLELMTSHLKRNMCDIKEPFKLDDEVGGPNDHVGKVIAPWLRYACLHWGEHVANALVGNPEVKTRLEEFCTRGVVYWLEAVSLLGYLEKAALFLDDIREWAVSIFLHF